MESITQTTRESLNIWISENLLKCQLVDRILSIDNYEGNFLIVEDKWVIFNNDSITCNVFKECSQDEPNAKNILFDNNFEIVLTNEEMELAADDAIKYFLFEFGDQWYYFNKNEKVNLIPFKYLGLANIDHELNFPFLGLHGKYELCNGSRDYKDWCKKAKFLGISSLGICENQTLAGTYNFQLACKEHDIKSILGSIIKIKSQDKDYFYYLKTYVINDKGWNNLLHLNKIQIVDRVAENKYVSEAELLSLQEGLYFVFNSDTDLELIDSEILYNLKNTYFQLDPVQWKYDSRDRDYLLLQKKYLDNFLEFVPPILITDAYYLDVHDYVAKDVLNKILNITYNYKSEDQYFKSCELVINQLLSLFSDDKIDIISIARNNAFNVQDNCNYTIVRTDMHLPQYEMNEDEKLLYNNNLDLFYSLIQQGFEEKIVGKVNNEEIYLSRVEKEIEVLTEGNVIDYFLILADIVKWCKKNDILPGLGRGSSAGSLISYLLGIVEIDPIKYDLLFERFLNKARLLGGSLPDIDFDCPSNNRQDIINYMINKYGKDHVCFVGTAQNFKLKSSLKDIIKIKGIDASTSNFLTSLISKEYDFASITGLFEVASKELKIKEIIQKFPEIIKLINLIIFQPRSFGIHAAAVIISPKFDKYGNSKTIYDYLPIRTNDGQLITEWEKEAVESIGMLKEDMLGLTQLDKIMRIRQLIKQNNIIPPLFEDIDLADQNVFKLFQQGITEDVFQFNTSLQKQYCIELQPTNINDLIAANAIMRPGAMENNSHKTYIKVKNGEINITLPTMLEDILRDTHGLFIFQESAMLSFQKITNCDLNEADNFRKVITKLKPGKKNPEIEKYEQIFKESYIKITNQEEVNKVWDMIIGFASYGFNKSHSCAYAITGYWACWYKFYYPVEFYATSLEMCDKDENLQLIISEINDRKLVNLKSPDINKSHTRYSIDKKTNSIYWSLSSIKYVGDKAVDVIIQERTTNGNFYSFEEFVERVKGKNVNVRVITNLIVCGAFDEIENLTSVQDRLKLLYLHLSTKISVEFTAKEATQEYFWILKQKELCGLGDIDYKVLYKNYIRHLTTFPYYSNEFLQLEENVEKRCTIIGIVKNIVERNTKKGKLGQVEFDCNGNKILVTCWNEFWKEKSFEIVSNLNKIILITGIIKRDGYRKNNCVNTIEGSKLIII